jgi:hypothetical protein
MLTDKQIAVLVWMVETGPEPHLLLPRIHGPGGSLSLVGSGSANLDVSDADISELAALELIRAKGRNTCVVTNSGREVYDRLKNPPPERQPFGFSRTP